MLIAVTTPTFSLLLICSDQINFQGRNARATSMVAEYTVHNHTSQPSLLNEPHHVHVPQENMLYITAISIGMQLVFRLADEHSTKMVTPLKPRVSVRVTMM